MLGWQWAARGQAAGTMTTRVVGSEDLPDVEILTAVQDLFHFLTSLPPAPDHPDHHDSDPFGRAFVYLVPAIGTGAAAVWYSMHAVQRSFLAWQPTDRVLLAAMAAAALLALSGLLFTHEPLQYAGRAGIGAWEGAIAVYGILVFLRRRREHQKQRDADKR